MRLTLRTLLGYLDDILEPIATKELGERISESSVATSLVVRIKDVTRRRRVLAPAVTGPGSEPDANVTAEYLDNTLAPEKVEDLERLCLESDTHLAEVASCHQILTLVLGEPVDIPQAMRERIYALGSTATAEAGSRVRQEEAQAAATTTPAPPVVARATSDASPVVPDYLRSGTSWRKLIPLIACFVIIGLWLGLIVSDPANSWRVWETGVESVSQADPAAQSPPAGNALAANTAGGNGTALPGSDPTAAVSAHERPLTPAALLDEETIDSELESPAITGIDPPPPPDAPEEGATSGTEVAMVESIEGEPLLAIDPSVPETNPTPAEGLPVQGNSAANVADTGNQILYDSAEGVLLHLDLDGEWRVLPRRSLVRSGDQLASPEPFSSKLTLIEAESSLELLGQTRLTLESAPPGVAVGMQFAQGRIVLRRSPANAAEVPVAIQMRLGGVAYLIELMEAGTECGIEVVPRLSAATPDIAQVPSFDGGMLLTAGSAVVTSEQGTIWTLKPGSAALAFVDGVPATTPEPLISRPDWLQAPSGGSLAIAMTTARQFEDAFVLDQPAAATIPALIDNRHPRISQLAVQTLAVTLNVRGMVRGLFAPHEEARQAAIIGLATLLRNDPGSASAIEAELLRSSSPADAPLLMRFLWGYSAADAHNPELSLQLVTALESSQVAVRELAFFQIRRLTGGELTFRYHPDASESVRKGSVNQWQGHLRKEGALRTAAPASDPSPDTALPPTE
jgi:hypothetical protein